jgi:hypothetical protein
MELRGKIQMNTKNIVPLNYSEKLCFKCLKEYNPSDMTTIYIFDQGYGSLFDGFNSKLQLCPDCYNKCDTSMWSMEIQTDEENYPYSVWSDSGTSTLLNELVLISLLILTLLIKTFIIFHDLSLRLLVFDYILFDMHPTFVHK